eukprot:3229096-Prymnesium_polylepis.1
MVRAGGSVPVGVRCAHVGERVVQVRLEPVHVSRRRRHDEEVGLLRVVGEHAPVGEQARDKVSHCGEELLHVDVGRISPPLDHNRRQLVHVDAQGRGVARRRVRPGERERAARPVRAHSTSAAPAVAHARAAARAAVVAKRRRLGALGAHLARRAGPAFVALAPAARCCARYGLPEDNARAVEAAVGLAAVQRYREQVALAVEMQSNIVVDGVQRELPGRATLRQPPAKKACVVPTQLRLGGHVGERLSAVAGTWPREAEGRHVRGKGTGLHALAHTGTRPKARCRAARHGPVGSEQARRQCEPAEARIERATSAAILARGQDAVVEGGFDERASVGGVGGARRRRDERQRTNEHRTALLHSEK